MLVRLFATACAVAVWDMCMPAASLNMHDRRLRITSPMINGRPVHAAVEGQGYGPSLAVDLASAYVSFVEEKFTSDLHSLTEALISQGVPDAPHRKQAEC